MVTERLMLTDGCAPRNNKSDEWQERREPPDGQRLTLEVGSGRGWQRLS